LPSAPEATALAVPTGYSLIVPPGVMVPSLPIPVSTIQMSPSAPRVMPFGAAPGVMPALNSWITCVVGSIRPLADGLPLSLNQSAPSEPVSMICGTLPGFRPALNSCTAWVVGSTTPIAFGVP
jgi:hypothetical protein